MKTIVCFVICLLCALMFAVAFWPGGAANSTLWLEVLSFRFTTCTISCVVAACFVSSWLT